MVKVKIIKNNPSNEFGEYIDNVYEAFIDNHFGEGYCVDFLDKIIYVPKEYCEEVNGSVNQNEKYENIATPNKKTNCGKILLVEDGSVDVDYIEEDLGIKCIVYRQGANKPEWLELGE